MEYQEAITKLCEKDFLDKLYGFAYKRSNTSFEAEDLSSEIILSIIRALKKVQTVDNLYGFVWTVAHRVYADYCEKRNKHSAVISSKEFSDEILNLKSNIIEEYMESEEDKEQLNSIIRELSFLSKIYRDVMVLYYIDELSISAIGTKLNLSETAVKQRLFWARNTIKKEAMKMDKNYTLKPMNIQFIGTGSPGGNDPSEKAERVLSKNVIYLCKNEALSPKEISEKLHVPMPFIEDELEILTKGMNGHYGVLRKLENGKYISNIIILDEKEYKEASYIYVDALDEFTELLVKYLDKNKEKIASFSFLGPKRDIRFITWILISKVTWALNEAINRSLSTVYLSDIKPAKREFTLSGVATDSVEEIDLYFYGSDGIAIRNFYGYKKLLFENIYGARKEKHYDCGKNLTEDPQFNLLIKALDGIDILLLSEEEKEIAAKAIERGLVEKKDNQIIPRILVLDMDCANAIDQLTGGFVQEVEELGKKVAGGVFKMIKKQVPKHLIDDYPMFTTLVKSPLLYYTIETCIEKDILTTPQKMLCPEGSWLIVEK